MNKQDILNIRLGARQIPLGFEKDLVKEQEVVASDVREFAERHGEVVLHGFVQYVKDRRLDLTVAEILQLIFRLASEHEIEFRVNDKNVAPHEVKKILLEFTDAEVFIIFHQPVEDVVLEEVQRIYDRLTGQQESLTLPDPHDLSRLLAKQIRYWQDCLNSCRQGVKSSRFPGEKMITDGLLIIKKISAKLDPFSLIYAFHANREEIFKLSEEVKTLYAFYTRHAKTWEDQIRAVDAFDGDLAELNDIPDVAEDLDRLKRILSSEWPYDQVEEAKQLVDSITPRHMQIVKEKTAKYRQEAAARIDDLIEKMARLKDGKKVIQDLRRQALQDLRSIAKKIPLAGDICAISQLTGEAEDLYDEFKEEIQTISP
jgi:hypothetical protein